MGELEINYPHLKETMLSAMGNLEPSRLLDLRYLNPDAVDENEGAREVAEGARENNAQLLPILV